MRIHEKVHLVGSEQFALSHALDCNCYLIDGGSELGLIDTGLGLGVDEICANIQAAGFNLRSLAHILITHSHIGHWGGANELRRRSGAQVWAHVAARPKMADISEDPGIRINMRFRRYPAGFAPVECHIDSTLDDGQTIHIGDVEVRAILTQGHTKDSLCFVFEDSGRRALATGDTVFYGGKVGLLNLEGCSLEDYRRDIHKLADLGIEMLLPGHGVFTLGRGQRHIDRAIHKLTDFVLPESFFETNELMWDHEYLQLMTR